MKTILLLFLALFLIKGDLTLFDFNSAETAGKWYVVNDDVMGGVSKSEMRLNDNGTATFSGTLSSENYGGFASARVPVQALEDSNFKGMKIRLRGDGNIYSLRFRTTMNFDGYAYQAKVRSKKGEWNDFEVPFSDFQPTYRGRTLTGKPALKSDDIAQFGLLIADEQFGEFTVDIDWIKFYE